MSIKVTESSLRKSNFFQIKKEKEEWRKVFLKIYNNSQGVLNRLPGNLKDILASPLNNDIEYGDYLKLAILGYILHAIKK